MVRPPIPHISVIKVYMQLSAVLQEDILPFLLLRRAISHARWGKVSPELTCASSAAGYDLLLKVEYKGRTLWDCAGSNPSDPANNPGCTVVPPGGLQAKLHLPVLSLLPCLPLTTNAKRAFICPDGICRGASAIQECTASL